MTTTLAHARALIAAAERAKAARADYRLRPKPEIHDYRDRCRNDAPDIAAALVEAVKMLRALTDLAEVVAAEYDGADIIDRQIAAARDWLAKHDGEQHGKD